MYEKDNKELKEENKRLKATIDAFARQVRRLETRLMKYEKVDRGRFIDKTLTTSEQESLFSNHL